MSVSPSSSLPSLDFTEPGDLFASPAFMDLGSCRGMDPDIFFPDRGESLAPAKAICDGCIVKDECLDYAVENVERFGVWGGASERERRRIRRQRALARQAASGASA
jgi:WhiB family redox-sensing transcriptional regulator